MESKFKHRLLFHTKLSSKYEYKTGKFYLPKNWNIQPKEKALNYYYYNSNILHFIKYLNLIFSTIITKSVSLAKHIYERFNN